MTRLKTHNCIAMLLLASLAMLAAQTGRAATVAGNSPAPIVKNSSASTVVKIETIQKPSSCAVLVSNASHMPVTVSLQLGSFSNLASSRRWPIQVQLDAEQSMELVELTPVNSQFGYTFDYTSQIVQGDPRAQHDATVSYRIPFVADQGFQIVQAADGPIFSHQSVATRYAVDISMPLGTAVVAARSGLVAELVSHFADDGKAEPDYFDKANYVRILHDDGTWADYFHLKQHSIIVRPGQRLEAGDALGLSGNSGFSTTPHLHFHVQANQNGTIVSLPFRFSNAHDGVFSPHYQAWLFPDAIFHQLGKAKARKNLRECLPTGKNIDEAVIRCLTAS